MNPRTNPATQYELLRLLIKYDNFRGISLCLAMYERQMAHTGIDKKRMGNLHNYSIATRRD